jgi:hypothetical protein
LDSTFKIGLTQADLTDIEVLTVQLLPPYQTFDEAAAQLDLASGGVRDMGFPVITWHWAWLDDDQWGQLRTFCTGRSAAVFIQSPDDKDTDTIYKAMMIWPAGGAIESGKHLDVTIEFRHCEEQED